MGRIIKRAFPRIEIFEADNGRFYFHKRHHNGRITNPSQGYKERRYALSAARRDLPGLPVKYIDGYRPYSRTQKEKI